ncbi:MAG: DUF6054 family protein [Candidatus Thorarchaeota archaeon]
MKTLNFDSQYLERVIDYLSYNYSGVTRRISKTEQGVMAIFIHEEYAFRTGSYQSLTTIVESKGDFGQATVTVVGSGGGGGICNFNWGSQSAGEDTILKNIQNLIHHHGGQREDSYWDI